MVAVSGASGDGSASSGGSAGTGRVGRRVACVVAGVVADVHMTLFGADAE